MNVEKHTDLPTIEAVVAVSALRALRDHAADVRVEGEGEHDRGDQGDDEEDRPVRDATPEPVGLQWETSEQKARLLT